MYCDTLAVTLSTATSRCVALDPVRGSWRVGTAKTSAAMSWLESAGAVAATRNPSRPNVWLGGSRSWSLLGGWTVYRWSYGRLKDVAFSAGTSLSSGFTGLRWSASSGGGDENAVASSTGLFSVDDACLLYTSPSPRDS
eukprot:TRINITY_DN36464_c0_g1_i1.p1 TRINITY_DN36464_c0_g1~~TRINITY_DN36464_c0_g1_i1.p1  ORF type:complete len:139 (-),score=6.38 TRINITY_DN36464_c0_g1_i1:91-507(-)